MSEQQRPDPQKREELQAQNKVDKWIAFVLLVVAVGVGALYFGTDTATAPGNQAATTVAGPITRLGLF